MNAFRLGKSLGTHLVVGVNFDELITTCKGTPLLNDQERLTMVQGCKFVVMTPVSLTEKMSMQLLRKPESINLFLELREYLQQILLEECYL